jgi:hypothetical protein
MRGTNPIRKYCACRGIPSRPAGDQDQKPLIEGIVIVLAVRGLLGLYYCRTYASFFQSEIGSARVTREEQAMAEIERVAIVTGAAGGIGRAMVRGLWRQGSGSLALIAIESRLRRLRRARASRVR